VVTYPADAGCPEGGRCESCAAQTADLAAVVVPLAEVGLGCLTLCTRCRTSGEAPAITLATAVRLVEQHAEHVRGGGHG
jgi:hypothetical protein